MLLLHSQGVGKIAKKRKGLTARGRKRIKPKNFAIPKGKGRNKSKNQYPIHDLAHARNALARVGQRGTPAEKKMVYNAVRRKYPALAKRSSVIPKKRKK